MSSLKPKEHWGPKLWSYIHTITIVNNNDRKENQKAHEHIITILHSITSVIPCPKCVHGYKLFLERLIYLDLSQPMILFYWSVDLHNYVNSKLNKKQLTYDQAIMIWAE
jgi:hypothetical protein